MHRHQNHEAHITQDAAGSPTGVRLHHEPADATEADIAMLDVLDGEPELQLEPDHEDGAEYQPDKSARAVADVRLAAGVGPGAPLHPVK